MKQIVLFKSDSEEYRNAFNESGYVVTFIEPLQFELINTTELTSRLSQRHWTGLVVTSPRAVDALAACWDLNAFTYWNTRRIYTLGPATKAKIKLSLGLDALGASAGNGQNLAKIVTNENSALSEFFLPCGNLSSESLPDLLRNHGLSVDTLTVYQTKENERLRDELIQLNDAEQEPCGLVFFSPSGCEYIHRQLQTFDNKLYHLPHFAIGNSTAHKIENLGIEIAGIAAEPRPESVRLSVDNYLQKHEGR